MAVTEVGTPGSPQVTSGSLSGSVTGVWSGTQPRTSGDLLEACVTAYGTTTAGAISTPAGWTQQVSQTSSTGRIRTAIYTKKATGSDAAPTFTATMTGTAAQAQMTCLLREKTGQDPNTPVATLGTGDGTTSPVTITTAGNVPAAGCMGTDCVLAGVNAAGTPTLAASTSPAWTKTADTGSTSARSHAIFSTISNPTSGATLADSPTISLVGGGTLLEFTGVSIVVQPPVVSTPAPQVVTVFADTGTCTIQSGPSASVAPAAGTVETWQADTTALLPQIGTGLTQQYYGADATVAGSTETVLVTVDSGGGSITVTRGADGTTPVPHTCPFTLHNVVPKGWLNAPSGTGVPVFAAYYVNGISGAVYPCRFVGATLSGAPTSGTFIVGDVVIDLTGTLWICITAGSPGTWTQASSSGGPPTGAAGGDLSGSYPNPTVAKLDGLAVGTSPGGTTSFLRADGNWAAPPGGATIDSTAADIQPDGVQAAGSTGLAADAGHVHPEKAWDVLLTEPSGALAVTMPRRMCNVASTATSGSAFFTSIGLAKGIVVAHITMIVGSTPQTSGTHGWYALCDSGWVVRAVSADQTSTIWTGAGAAITLAMASPYTVPTAGVYYVVMSQSTTGTAPSIVGFAAISQANITPVLGGTLTGQTTPPTVGTTLTTPTAGTTQMYAYVS